MSEILQEARVEVLHLSDVSEIVLGLLCELINVLFFVHLTIVG